MSIYQNYRDVKWFICQNCKEQFPVSDAMTVTETHGLTEPPFEQFASCPFCSSVNLANANRCLCCNEVFDDADLYYGFCPKCQDEHFNVDIGRKYLVEKGLELDFLGYVHGIDFNIGDNCDKNILEQITMLLRKNYFQHVYTTEGMMLKDAEGKKAQMLDYFSCDKSDYFEWAKEYFEGGDNDG